jgi:spore coat polysaccharide biosynthesis protein SpsF
MTGRRVGIILQARMGSTRLPGKVLKPLCGPPMLARIIGRLKQVPGADVLIVATSDRPADDAVAELGRACGAEVFRGSEADVLDRFTACARAFGLSAVVRATGDNPFVDIEEAGRLIAFLDGNGLDYACAFPEFGSSLPVGTGVEIITADALEQSWRDGTEPHHREHVNEYIQERPAIFRQACLEATPEKCAPGLRLTVDTPDDFARAERLLALYTTEGGEGEPGTAWLIAACRRLDA